MPGQSIPFNLAGNSVADIPIPYWPPGSVGVTNPGSTWLHFAQSAGADSWIPPRQYGVMVRPPVTTGAIRVDSTGTPSIIYPIDLSDLSPALITVWEDAWPLSPGQSLSALIPSAAISLSGVIAQGVIQAIAQTTLDQAAAATIVLNAPTGIQNGDVLVALVANTDASAITDPAGWTRVLFGGSAGAGGSGGLAWSVHTAIPGDPASWTWTGANLTDGIVAAYRGVEGVVAVEASASQSTKPSANTGPVATPALTTITPNDWLLASFSHVATSNTVNFTTPVPLTQRAQATNSLTHDLLLYDSNGVVPPGSHGPYISTRTGGGSGVDSFSVIVALIPQRAPMDLAEINGRLFDAATKGVQPTLALPTQDLKDSGRAQVMLSWEEMAGTAAAESALTNFTLGSLNAAALTAANNYQVSAGKRLRIQSVTIYLKSTSTVEILARYRIRQAGAVANNSPVILDAVMALDSATIAATQGDQLAIPIPDNLEVAAGQQITFTWFTSVNTCTVGMSIAGFEY